MVVLKNALKCLLLLLRGSFKNFEIFLAKMMTKVKLVDLIILEIIYIELIGLFLMVTDGRIALKPGKLCCVGRIEFLQKVLFFLNKNVVL